MVVRVAVAGASGYAGGELLRIIGGHPDLELGPLAAATSAGAPVTAAHPHLAHLDEHIFEPLDPAPAVLGRPGLPRTPARGVGRRQRRPACRDPGGGPVRQLPPGRSAGMVGRTTATPHAGQWCYGLPELPGARERDLPQRGRVAAPGCYATAAILALAPAARGRAGRARATS